MARYVIKHRLETDMSWYGLYSGDSRILRGADGILWFDDRNTANIMADKLNAAVKDTMTKAGTYNNVDTGRVTYFVEPASDYAKEPVSASEVDGLVNIMETANKALWCDGMSVDLYNAKKIDEFLEWARTLKGYDNNLNDIRMCAAMHSESGKYDSSNERFECALKTDDDSPVKGIIALRNTDYNDSIIGCIDVMRNGTMRVHTMGDR